MPADPVFWRRAQLSWSSTGYVAAFPLWVEERALLECAGELRQQIADALEGQQEVEIELEPMVKTKDAAEHGWLKIVTPAIIGPGEAIAMRDSVTPFLNSAMETTNRLAEADEVAANKLRDALNQPNAG